MSLSQTALIPAMSRAEISDIIKAAITVIFCTVSSIPRVVSTLCLVRDQFRRTKHVRSREIRDLQISDPTTQHVSSTPSIPGL